MLARDENSFTNSETLEELVLYFHVDEKEPTIWARPIGMFQERVDKEKYPSVTQEYRFELIKEKSM